MRMGYIYKITNPNGKIYVGQTVNLARRKRSYAKNESRSTPIIYNSIIKYGWENHVFEIIEEISIDDNDETTLDEREIFWIEFFDSFRNGMNLTAGGKGNYKRVCSDETKEKIRIGNKGKILSDETKKLIGIASRGRTHILTDEIKNKLREANLGNRHTDDAKKKISESQLGVKKSEEHAKKIRESNTGKIRSEDARANISKAKKGKPWSEARRLAQQNKKK